jgi:hypothetical protein
MPRALEVLDVALRGIERGEIGAIEAIDALRTNALSGPLLAVAISCSPRQLAELPSGQHVAPAIRKLPRVHQGMGSPLPRPF